MAVSPASSESEHIKYFPTKRWLGHLCTKFTRLYNQEDRDRMQSIIDVEATAVKLGTKTDRIRDLLNILKILGVVARKNNYFTWKGLEEIPVALQELKEGSEVNSITKASEENSGTNAIASVSSSDDDEEIDTKKISDDEESSSSFDFNCNPSPSPSPSTGSQSQTPLYDIILPRSQKMVHGTTTNLALLAQSFVKIFLCYNVKTITTDDAAIALLGDVYESESQEITSKYRCIRGIANVLISLGLAEKTYAESSSEDLRPLLRWLGFKGEKCNESIPYNSNQDLSMNSENSLLVENNTGQGKVDGWDLTKSTNDTSIFQFGPFHPYSLETSENNSVELAEA